MKALIKFSRKKPKNIDVVTVPNRICGSKPVFVPISRSREKTSYLKSAKKASGAVGLPTGVQ
jgi:hypothetical protein